MIQDPFLLTFRHHGISRGVTRLLLRQEEPSHTEQSNKAFQTAMFLVQGQLFLRHLSVSTIYSGNKVHFYEDVFLWFQCFVRTNWKVGCLKVLGVYPSFLLRH